MKFPKFLVDAEGELEIARASGAAVVAVFLGLSVYSVVIKGHRFDMQSFGIGAGAVIASLGAALKLNPKTRASGGDSQ